MSNGSTSTVTWSEVWLSVSREPNAEVEVVEKHYNLRNGIFFKSYVSAMHGGY